MPEPRPAAVLDLSPIAIDQALAPLGYERHRHLRITREGEVFALRKLFAGGRRQLHVQLCRLGDGRTTLFAHTERVTEDLIGHTLDLVNRTYSFPAGSRMLRRDLRAARLI